jgi:O-Antigen ligase
VINTSQISIPRIQSIAVTKRARYPKIQKFKLPLVLALVHVPLGLLLYRSSMLALAHPLAVLSLGLYFAIRKNEKIERAAYVAAYLVGAEVLWRMGSSPIFWEFGKYAAASIMITALARRRHWKMPSLPLLYFALLIPASFLTIIGNSLTDARAKLSSNMSGPLLIFVTCWFFSHVRLKGTQLKKLLTLIAVPLISVAIMSLFYTVTIEDIQFTNESNWLTSGGFGPNQVSAMLGLGVFVCLASYLLFKTGFRDLLYFGLLSLLFATQSVMTFSRGGMYNAIGGTLAIVFFQFRDFAPSLKKMVPLIGVSVIFLLLIFPFINDFTGGKLQERFEDTTTTNRVEIIESEFQIFLENPILGIGVGEAKSSRMEFLDLLASSHTEFSRVISEHGSFGILALVALSLATINNFRRQASPGGRALIAGLIVWSTLFMFNAGMRLAAPAFMWGLASVSIVLPHFQRKNGQNTLEMKTKLAKA